MLIDPAGATDPDRRVRRSELSIHSGANAPRELRAGFTLFRRSRSPGGSRSGSSARSMPGRSRRSSSASRGSTSTRLPASPSRCRRSAPRATWHSSSTIRLRWPNGSGPMACISGRGRRCGRSARRARARGADRGHLPRQPPPGAGSRRGGGGLRRFRSFFPSTTKASEHRPELELLDWWQR